MDQDDIIDTLNDLIETCKDGEYGFKTSAEQAKDQELKLVFDHRANTCRQAAAELNTLVVQLGGEADDSGSTVGAMHRGWVAVKSAITGHSDLALLEEAETGEDSALASYREALGDELPTAVRAVVERQYEGVKTNHASIRTLRDLARADKERMS